MTTKYRIDQIVILQSGKSVTYQGSHLYTSEVNANKEAETRRKMSKDSEDFIVVTVEVQYRPEAQ